MARYKFERRVFEGAPLFAAGLSTQITVLDLDTLTLAPLFDAETGTDTPGNPFFITEIGKFSFWVEDGSYRVTAVNGGNTDTWEGQIGPYGGDAGITSFSQLDDVPSYAGNANRGLKVNLTQDAVVVGEPDVTAGTTDSSYSLSMPIWNNLKAITGSGTVNVTIPSDSTLNLPVGYVHIVNPVASFTGTCTWVAESGSVTVEPPAGGTLVTPAGGVSAAMKRGGNEWVVFGNTVAS